MNKESLTLYNMGNAKGGLYYSNLGKIWARWDNEVRNVRKSACKN